MTKEIPPLMVSKDALMLALQNILIDEHHDQPYYAGILRCMRMLRDGFDTKKAKPSVQEGEK